MKKIGQPKGESPSQLIDARIKELGSWRGDAILDPGSDQAGRPSRGRGDEVGRCSGVVSQRADLHQRDVQ
jgi:hypothetical protein